MTPWALGITVVIAASLLFYMCLWLRSRWLLTRPTPVVHYSLADYLPPGCQARRLRLERADVLLVTRGRQDPGVTPSIIFVPGWGEDVRVGLVSLTDWMAETAAFRLTVLNKTGYRFPFSEEDLPGEEFESPLELAGEVSTTISWDGETTRALLLADPLAPCILWGHSQGGATIQEAVTRWEASVPRLDERLLPKIRGVVLEASVLPGGRVSGLVWPGVFEPLTAPFLNVVPLLHRLDVFLLGIARRRLHKFGRRDIAARLAVFDQPLYRFDSFAVALANGRSVLSFMGEGSRLAVLRELREAGRLVGLFPEGVDLVLDAKRNRRIIREVFEEEEAQGLWIVAHTHFVTLEEPAWATRVLAPLLETPAEISSK